jgi:hypothetical protein
MCITACFTHLSFPFGRQGEHIIHDSWIQLRNPGHLAVGSIPFVPENGSDFFSLLDGQFLHPVASELRPGELLGRHEHFIVVQEYSFAQAGGYLMLRLDIPENHFSHSGLVVQSFRAFVQSFRA